MLTNKHNLPISVAVWLSSDDYERSPNPNTISVTTLIKPIKQIILGKRAAALGEIQNDISDFTAVKLGNAIHDSIEYAWKSNYKEALKQLNVPESFVDTIGINPTSGCSYPIYIEQRTEKPIGKWTVTGKFDFVIDGQLEDFKSVTVWGYQKGGNVQQYVEQGSIYRWLNQDKITSDTIQIIYILKDWMKSKSTWDKSYPQAQIIPQHYPLMSVEATETFIINRINTIEHFMDKPETDIPPCSDEELWRNPPVYKYYKDPNKTTRSTNNCDTLAEARLKMSENGGIGIIKEVKGEIKRCKYCSAINICNQKNQYIVDGSLKLED